MRSEHPTHDYMRVTEHRALADQWEAYKGFTIRPLPSTQAYYKSVVERFTTPKDQLLVYGGTPEIRTAIQEVSRDAILVDRAPLMVEAMGLLTPAQKYLGDRETLMAGNWLDMPLKGPVAKLALGDDAVNMVPWESFPQFMKGTHDLLVPGGLVACHLLVQPMETFRRQSVDEVFKEYESGRITSQEDLASRVNFTFYDDASYQMGWQRSIQGIKDAGIEDDHGFTNRFEKCNSIFACPPQEEFENMIKPMFDIQEVFYPTEYDYAAFEPLYLLRKNG